MHKLPMHFRKGLLLSILQIKSTLCRANISAFPPFKVTAKVSHRNFLRAESLLNIKSLKQKTKNKQAQGSQWCAGETAPTGSLRLTVKF